ncbi:TerD family protein [Massilia terrae]|uniref:TerD family protein n=1 Tax=Massilia terrae TaxID=1811224 RepID=A0ABT2D5Q5_9BURK|nr:TerD family protein [Massilia terrae]MCS0660710.1 TerD family protein [Massilia terrae]
MAIHLQKGGNVSLSQEAPGVQRVIIGLGWAPEPPNGTVCDLDSSAFLLRADGKVKSDDDFVFYNNLRSEDGSVEHAGDKLTSPNTTDEEQLEVDLAHVPPDIQRIAVAVTIRDAEARHQDFGMVSHAFIRCVDADSDREIARFDLSEDYSSETSLVFGELVRANGDWRFRAVGQGYRGGLSPLARSYGVDA